MKIKCILLKVFLLAAALQLSSCIGIQTVYNKKIPSVMLPDWSVEGRYIGPKLINTDHIYTKQEVIDLVGKPRREWSNDGYDYIAYSNRGKGWKWYGVIVWMVVPIPLLVPVGVEESILSFKDDKLEEVIENNSKGAFFGCIIINTIHQNKDGSYNDKSIHDLCANFFNSSSQLKN